MRVFSSFENRPATTEKTRPDRLKKSGPKKSKKSYRPPKEQLSADEIKARVAQKTSKATKAAVQKAKINTGKQVSTFMADNIPTKVDISKKAIQAKQVKEASPKAVPVAKEAKAEEVQAKKEKSVILNSDVDKNDPNDPNVRKKLKGLLAGGFGWSDKEKAALAEILDKD
jgi:hypothetical protein